MSPEGRPGGIRICSGGTSHVPVLVLLYVRGLEKCRTCVSCLLSCVCRVIVYVFLPFVFVGVTGGNSWGRCTNVRKTDTGRDISLNVSS